MYKIGILFQNRDFEHDVYELIKAFYPGNEITSLYEEDDADYKESPPDYEPYSS